ncbi:hypothetical protein F8M41_005959 [Gigaspora margarita]|uniref:Myb/SANT-like DNA-binding domain-containing protein n=1 Tax=Gigaspora margarita TaxID=4874 RepID=A0A8H3X8K1_GIGMA|nr:hypothetical protein F8M41_005959 [Gigaspora margarita]
MDQFTSTIASTKFIDYVPPSSLDNNVISQTQQIETSNKLETSEDESDYHELIPSSKFWSDSETRALISYLAENFNLYRKNKTKIYGMAAIKIGNNRTSAQVSSKIQSLKSRYEKENKEETGKARSKWAYLDDMNEIFGNRENVKPDYLLSSINLDDESDDNDLMVSNKKRKISEIDQIYLDELKSLRKAKKKLA